MTRQRRRGSESQWALDNVSDPGATVTAARDLNRASSIIAASVLMDSAVEHYRGLFHNKAIYAPLVSSALSLLAGFHGAGDRRSAPHPARDTVYGAAAHPSLTITAIAMRTADRIKALAARGEL
jgi:hypothetical protein